MVVLKGRGGVGCVAVEKNEGGEERSLKGVQIYDEKGAPMMKSTAEDVGIFFKKYWWAWVNNTARITLFLTPIQSHQEERRGDKTKEALFFLLLPITASNITLTKLGHGDVRDVVDGWRCSKTQAVQLLQQIFFVKRRKFFFVCFIISGHTHATTIFCFFFGGDGF